MLDGLKARDQTQASDLAKSGPEDPVVNERTDPRPRAINRRSRWLYAADLREASPLELREKGPIAGPYIQRPDTAGEAIYDAINQMTVGATRKVRLLLAIEGCPFVCLV
jgi:hypothetical protein